MPVFYHFVKHRPEFKVLNLSLQNEIDVLAYFTLTCCIQFQAISIAYFYLCLYGCLKPPMLLLYICGILCPIQEDFSHVGISHLSKLDRESVLAVHASCTYIPQAFILTSELKLYILPNHIFHLVRKEPLLPLF